MTHRARALLALLTGAAAVAAAPRAWLSDGPPPGHTGGFGEPTCSACHQPGGTLAPGEVVLSGLPPAFQPGSQYDFEVISRRSGLTRAGFQLAVRYASGDSAGRQAGTVRALEPLRSGFTWDNAMTVAYTHHTVEGTLAQRPGEVRWRLRWLAPAAGAPVVFHAASVQANDDNSPLDDEVRITAIVVPPAVP